MRVVHIAPGPTPTLRIVGAGLDEVVHAVGGHDVARDDRDAEAEVARRCARAREHALLVAVRRVDDEHVDAGGGERPRLRGDVAVDADRGGDAAGARRVDGRLVERAAQRAAAAERADDAAVLAARGANSRSGVDDEVERAPRRSRRRRRRARRVPPCTRSPRRASGSAVAEARRRRCIRRTSLGAHRCTHDAVARRSAAAAASASATVASGPRTSGGVEPRRLRLDPADGGVQVLQVQVLRQHARARRAGRASRRAAGPVTEFMFAETIGMRRARCRRRARARRRAGW